MDIFTMKTVAITEEADAGGGDCSGGDRGFH